MHWGKKADHFLELFSRRKNTAEKSRFKKYLLFLDAGLVLYALVGFFAVFSGGKCSNGKIKSLAEHGRLYLKDFCQSVST